MNTKIWGPSAWTFLHSLTFSQDTITKKTSNKWDKWPKKVADVLPCIFCRSTVKQYLNYFPLKSKNSITNVQQWFYNLHTRYFYTHA